MLYFIFNPDVIGVLIAHDYGKGEFVLQVPFFPPQENIELDFTRQKCFHKIKSFLPSDMNFSHGDLSIHSIGQWQMAARIAENFHDKSRRVILMGDAAHQFPPAGGFGMNTGIQDAHNLAWKLGYIMQGAVEKIGSNRQELLESYQQERMCVADMTLKLSMRNVERTMRVPSALQLSHESARNLTHFLNSPTINQLLPNSMRRGMLKNLMTIGTLPLHLASSKNSLVGQMLQSRAREIVESRQSLAMLFYHFDIGYSYETEHWKERARALMKDTALDYSSYYALAYTQKSSKSQHIYRPLFKIGMRFPHIWLSKRSLNGEISTLSSLALYWKSIDRARTKFVGEDLEKKLVPFLLILNGDIVHSHITKSLQSSFENVDVISIKSGEVEDESGCETYFAKESDILWNEFRRSFYATIVRPDGHIGHIWPLPGKPLTLAAVNMAISSSLRLAVK
uniref:Polyketide hydroxylase putative n=1 Tax=Albugo laibachii Nc14 TaxID=890382 RepID=F0VYL6_9STRA|nr:polyketide hydroxylase putative [Albugo laibachii Nc14]|eukprot:CCA13880.1 polyketide hydroxylase putative [Albugo laibachii Nc14]